MFDFDPASGQFSAWVSSQAIYRTREVLAGILSIDPSRIRVYNAEVGGGFGTKTGFVGEEIVAALLAVKLRDLCKFNPLASPYNPAPLHRQPTSHQASSEE